MFASEKFDIAIDILLCQNRFHQWEFAFESKVSHFGNVER